MTMSEHCTADLVARRLRDDRWHTLNAIEVAKIMVGLEDE